MGTMISNLGISLAINFGKKVEFFGVDDVVRLVLRVVGKRGVSGRRFLG